MPVMKGLPEHSLLRKHVLVYNTFAVRAKIFCD